MAVLAMAINDLGHEARSYTGSQAGLITDSTHGKARIIDVTPGRIQSAIADGAIAIVAGFQGVAQDTKDITTLGRGGSDTTAVALAAALGADVCEIYTDVDGIFTADPRIAPKARQVPRITYEEMLELAANGAKVLHLRCVEYARRFDLPIHVRSSFSNKTGTLVVSDSSAPEGEAVEQPIIAGVAHDLGDAKVTVVGVPDLPGKAAEIFSAVAEAGVNIDMIVQNVSGSSRRTDVTFTCPMADGQKALSVLEKVKSDIGFDDLTYDDGIAKISLVGAGMRSHPGVSATFFNALAEAGINVEMISTSEIRISVVTRADSAPEAVRAVHTAFGLDADGEAVVYGGTGR
jgi:aspartate kinase